MLNYAGCHQTVTLYRLVDGGITRQVLSGVYLWVEKGKTGECAPVRNFLLIVPGDQITLQVGDRIYDGIGPKGVIWEVFLPAYEPNVVEVGRVRYYRLGGKTYHVEAEQAWN